MSNFFYLIYMFVKGAFNKILSFNRLKLYSSLLGLLIFLILIFTGTLSWIAICTISAITLMGLITWELCNL